MTPQRLCGLTQILSGILLMVMAWHFGQETRPLAALTLSACSIALVLIGGLTMTDGPEGRDHSRAVVLVNRKQKKGQGHES